MRAVREPPCPVNQSEMTVKNRIDRVGEPTAETNKRLAANQKNSGDPPE